MLLSSLSQFDLSILVSNLNETASPSKATNWLLQLTRQTENSFMRWSFNTHKNIWRCRILGQGAVSKNGFKRFYSHKKGTSGYKMHWVLRRTKSIIHQKIFSTWIFINVNLVLDVQIMIIKHELVNTLDAPAYKTQARFWQNIRIFCMHLIVRKIWYMYLHL